VVNTSDQKLEIAPGREVAAPPAIELPPAVLCEVIPTGGGEFRLRPIVCEWVEFNQRTLRALGLERQARTLTRLATAGFIRMRRLSPLRSQLHLPSLLAHCEAVEADPEFWNEARLEQWRRSYG